MSFLRVLIVCALGANASITQAGLTHVNDDAFAAMVLQENEVTRDSATNLDWLDVDAYVGETWDTVNGLLGTVGHILEDWRHATQAEVGVYFGNLGLPIGSYPATSTIFDGGTSAIAAEAYTGHPQHITLVRAFTATYQSEGVVYAPTFGDYSDATVTEGDFFANDDEGYSSIGHWLVRTSPSESVIPEPSTFSMLAFCGIAMAGYSRLRRRRK